MQSPDLSNILTRCYCRVCGISSLWTYLRVGCLSMKGRHRTARFGILTLAPTLLSAEVPPQKYPQLAHALVTSQSLRRQGATA